MIFYVSPYETRDAIQAAPISRWFAYLSDAKVEAQRLAHMSKEPQFVYKFEQCDCVEPILPQKTYRMRYSKIENQYITVLAADISEAVDIGSEIMKNTDFEYDNAWEITDEQT